jgi:hypothetical protein
MLPPMYQFDTSAAANGLVQIATAATPNDNDIFDNFMLFSKIGDELKKSLMHQALRYRNGSN